MKQDVNWVEDLVTKDKKFLSKVTLNGSDFSLIGNCDAQFNASIAHSYKEGSQRTVDEKMLKAVKYLKDVYAENEYDILFIKSLGANLEDNPISRKLREIGQVGENFIKDIVGNSSNIEAVRSAAATLKFWNNTNVTVNPPTFISYVTPKLSDDVIESPLSQLPDILDRFGGLTKNTDAVGALGNKVEEIARSIFGKEVQLVAPWYVYKSPNGYMPTPKAFDTLRHIENTFTLEVNETYKYIDLLINSLNIEASKQLIEMNGETFPYWIKLTCNFIPAYEVEQKYLKNVLGLERL